MMNIDWLRQTCLEFPYATEQIQWGNDLLFKVGGKMFALSPLEPAPVCLAFKCSDEAFAELTERPKVIPAPYLARAKWIALEAPEAISRGELAELLRASYDLVFAKLPKGVKERLSRPVRNSRKKSPRKNEKFAGRRRTRD
jgi:predicted DNA-binding protein (MmcQ/YjbR family)